MEKAVGILSREGLPHPFPPQQPPKKVRSDDLVDFL